MACRDAFLAGIEPFRTYKDNEARPELLPWIQVWRQNCCDALFCINASRRKSRQESCQWTPFALEFIIPQRPEETVCTKAMVEPFFTDPYWDHYRFTDYWKGTLLRRANVNSWDEYETGYPGSLMHEYHQASIRAGVNQNWPLMMKLLKQKVAALPLEERVPPDTLLIHLRLGDVIDYAVEDVPKLLLHQLQYAVLML